MMNGLGSRAANSPITSTARAGERLFFSVFFLMFMFFFLFFFFFCDQPHASVAIGDSSPAMRAGVKAR